MQVIGDLFPNGGESYSIEELLYIIRLHICIHLRKIKFIFNEIDKSEFVERFLELSLFYGLSSPLNSEMICIFPYF